MSIRGSTFEVSPELPQVLYVLKVQVLVRLDLSLGIATPAQEAILECYVQKGRRLTCKLQRRGILQRVGFLRIDEVSWMRQ